MIVPKQGFKKKYAFGGSRIFAPIANLLTGLAASNVAKKLSSSAIDLGKTIAKEGAKKALEAGKSASMDVGKKLVTKTVNL